MRRVVFNKKGGVGKTTIVCNLAAAAAAAGKKTLVVDLDPQGNATRYLLGERAADVRPTVADFFNDMLGFSLFGSGERAPNEIVHETGHPLLSVIPSSRELESLQTKLDARYKIYKLRDALRQLAFDEVYIDTPPALSFYTVSALIAAQRCLIPFDCDDFSRHALYALKGHVREIAADHNPQLEMEGIVVNQFQPRAKLPQQLVDELRDEGFPVLSPFLTTSVKIRESHQASRPLVLLAPSHPLARAYVELYEGLSRGSARLPTTRISMRQ